jgi:hypothetical protein
MESGPADGWIFAGECQAQAAMHPSAPSGVVGIHAWRTKMIDVAKIQEHAEVIGADGIHIGTVDRVEADRIKLTRDDSGEGSHRGHHHFVPLSLVAEVEDGAVRLSANADVAVTFEEEEGGRSTE